MDKTIEGLSVIVIHQCNAISRGQVVQEHGDGLAYLVEQRPGRAWVFGIANACVIHTARIVQHENDVHL